MSRNLNKLSFIIFASLLMLMLAGCPGFFQPRSSGGGTTTTPKFAFVANFQGSTAGTISVFTIDSTTGALTSAQSPVATGNSTATNGPAALVTVLGKYLYSANDGGTVSGFSVNTTTGALTVIPGSPFLAGTNPNSIIADPSGKFLYVGNSGSRDITAFSIASNTGALSQIGTFIAGSSSATAGQVVGLAMHPTGKFLLAAMDTDGIATFSINSTSGVLTFGGVIAPQAGATVQAVTIDKTGNFAYAADGSTGVEEFTVNTNTGALTLMASSPILSGNVPIVLTGDATGTHIYVANQSSNNVFSYGILANGSLSLLSGGTVGAGASPSGIAIDPSGKFVYVTNFGGGPDINVYSLDSSGKLVLSNTQTSGVAGANAAAITFL